MNKEATKHKLRLRAITPKLDILTGRGRHQSKVNQISGGLYGQAVAQRRKRFRRQRVKSRTSDRLAPDARSGIGSGQLRHSAQSSVLPDRQAVGGRGSQQALEVQKQFQHIILTLQTKTNVMIALKISVKQLDCLKFSIGLRKTLLNFKWIKLTIKCCLLNCHLSVTVKGTI